MRTLSASLAALALLYIDNSNAFWRMNCAIIQRGRIDPLVNPGDIAAHSHTIVGGSNIGINATYDTLFNSECTSCEIGQDKSAYWTPNLYYRYSNGSFYEVVHGGAVVYYLARGPNAESTIPFPKGLNILSGDKSARSYDNRTYTWGNAQYPGRPVADRVSFNCLDNPALPEEPWMFRTDCENGMRAQIHFQSCWNGKDLYKADNSHVAYQSGIDNGICPPTHPYQLPHIFLETLYSVNDVPDQQPGGKFVFSQGDPTGYGFHGDFQNGWDPDVIANATANCLVPDNFGQISACPALQASQSNGFALNCPERPPQIGEAVRGLISRLPGCINITEGPELAPAASMNCPPGYPRPTVTSTVDSTPLATANPSPGSNYPTGSSQQYLGCFNDSSKFSTNVGTLNSISYKSYNDMTVLFCQQYCKERGYRLSGVEYAQECYCDNGLNPTAQTGVAQCGYTCGGSIVNGGIIEYCGGNQAINIYNNTDPSFNAFGDNSNSAGSYSPPRALDPLPEGYLGCATDNNGGKALTGPTVDQANMTAAVCAAFCTSRGGHQYYGVEYGTQCYCGDTIAGRNFITNATTNPTSSICNMRCRTNGGQMCGGGNALSLYNSTFFRAPSLTRPVGKYVPKGCLTDPNNGQGRALQGAYIESATNSATSCIKYCLGQRYRFAGVKNGNQCLCGNEISTASGAQTTTCPSGLTLCPGSRQEWCGTANIINFFYSATL